MIAAEEQRKIPSELARGASLLQHFGQPGLKATPDFMTNAKHEDPN